MFRDIANWYTEWEEELLRVLENPRLAEKAPAGYRRRVACQLEKLSPIERQQLRNFSIAYRGHRIFIAAGKLALLLTLVGAACHIAFPQFGWFAAIGSANLLGFSMAPAMIGAWFNYRRIASKKIHVVTFAVAGMLGVLLFHAIGSLFGPNPFIPIFTNLPRALLGGAIGAGLLVAAPRLIIAMLRNRHYEKLAVQLQQDAERERLARELSESQLRLLRAQIEPHFLFNTLGAVQQLAQQGAPRAAELTANLITFLRASLTEMRCETVSLQQEFALVEAYLQVMKARLGERLNFTLELPDSLALIRVPSMILLTLAENAIKHGIEPSLRGGAVSVAAALREGRVHIRVDDSGVGLSPSPCTGLGLENVRRRLQLAHGVAASLDLRDAQQGATAEVIIPFVKDAE